MKSLAQSSCTVYSARTPLTVLLALPEARPPDLMGAAISIIIDDKKKGQLPRVAKPHTPLPMKSPSTRSPAVTESRCRQPSPSGIKAKLSHMSPTVTPSEAYMFPQRGAFPETTSRSTRTTSVLDKNYAPSAGRVQDFLHADSRRL
jgi:hypothetical protein